MKRVFTLIALFTFATSGAIAQFSTFQRKTPRLVTSTPIGDESVFWDALDASKLAEGDLVFQSTDPSFGPPAADGTPAYSDWLNTNDYGFNIPIGATIDAIEVRITRNALGGPGIRDNRLQLAKAGFLAGADYSNTSDVWGVDTSTAIYDPVDDPLWSDTWTPTEINDFSFGVALTTMKIGPETPDAIAQIDKFEVVVFYSTLFPIVLTNFDVKNVDGKVAISFTTESETKVKTLFIERSSDGRNYTDLFAIQPKGGANIRTNYNLTDGAPLLGTNYYRLKEIDVDGMWHYYETRVIKISSVSNKFQAYQNANKVVVNFNSAPGNYTLSLIDMNGAIVATKSFPVDKQAVQVTLDPPFKRTGIYLVNIRGGDNFNESRKLFIQR